jgi:hypothetical protein
MTMLDPVRHRDTATEAWALFCAEQANERSCQCRTLPKSHSADVSIPGTTRRISSRSASITRP